MKEVKEKITEKVVMPKKPGRKIKPWIILLAINLLMFASCIYLVTALPKKAQALNKARSDEQRVKESKNVDVTGLEYKPTKDNVDKLNSFYPEESGVIKFIEDVERLKNDGVIKDFSLVGQNAVKDKTGGYGLPFIVSVQGSWENINTGLQALQNLPYLIRAINIEARIVDEGVTDFKYGGFLYVSDNLAKTR